MNSQQDISSDSPVSSASATEITHSSGNSRDRIQRWLIRSVTLFLLLISAYWVYDRYTHVNVSDARIASTMISISTRVSGWITELPAEEGQFLEQGALIARIDQRDATLALEEAEADLAAMQSELQRLKAEKKLTAARIETGIERAQSQLMAARSSHQANLSERTRAEAEWQRAKPLFAQEIISREIWENKRNIYQQAKQKAEVSEARIRTQQAALEEAQVARQELAIYDSRINGVQHQLAEARSHLARLSSSLSDHTVLSPISGVVDEVFADAGEYVNPGQRLLIMHDPRKIWVSCNIKETDIRHVHLGSKARVSVDAYPDLDLSGEVTRIGNAATSQFALLPNPNPSGNFTKVTQRIEVRISLPQTDNLLKPGMMVEVEIDIDPDA